MIKKNRLAGRKFKVAAKHLYVRLGVIIIMQTVAECVLITRQA